jgi:hypothetical protein
MPTAILTDAANCGIALDSAQEALRVTQRQLTDALSWCGNVESLVIGQALTQATEAAATLMRLRAARGV